jgi:PAS domain S-box-containing protein
METFLTRIMNFNRNSMRVLIADDDPITLHRLASLIMNWGFDVTKANNGLDAVAILESTPPPDMALLDWEMPGLLGIEVCEKIRKMKDLKNLYVMMITARDEKKDMIRGFQAGVDDYLQKPIDTDELRARMKVGERIVSLEKELIKRALDAEVKYQEIFDSSIAGIIQFELQEGSPEINNIAINAANPMISKMMGYPANQLLKFNLSDIVHEADHMKLKKIIENIGGNIEDDPKFEIRLVRENSDILWSMISFSEMLGTITGSKNFVLTIEDITQTKTNQIEMMKKGLNYKLEEGKIYMVQEKIPSVSLEGFNDLISLDHNAIAISRRDEKGFRKMSPGVEKYIWLSETREEGSIGPELEKILKITANSPKKEIFFLDRLDYLVSRNNFDDVLHFIQKLKDIMIIKESIAFITIDPATMEKKELAFLMNECNEMEPYYKSNISEDLYLILKAVQRKNIMHVDATLNGIEEELNISRPTARKRVNQLIAFGYLIEKKNGREKTYNLSDKGRYSLEE